MQKIIRTIQDRRSRWKFNLLKPYLRDSENILDFGCGDLSLANYIVKNLSDTKITGVDVIDAPKTIKSKRINWVKYDGRTLPFKDSSFDTVIVFYVLHHCVDLKKAVAECGRVAKKRIVVVESIPHTKKEIPFMKFFDWLTNVIKFDDTPLPYKFRSINQWKKMFLEINYSITAAYHPKSYEDYVPFGKLYILEFIKNK